MQLEIIPFSDATHRDQVISLWSDAFGYDAAHNAPGLAIDKKLAFDDNLFFVAVCGQSVVGTVMAGYDGHRGWIYAVAVLPDFRKRGIGSRLLTFAEEKLSQLGCMKINLQIMEGNQAVERFYAANGYLSEKRISMGKQLRRNIPV
jgi:ribosomal protein S18 acetylase RimI-like enzyme